MFFTHIGRVIAILMLVLAAFQIALGLMIATEFLGPYEEALARYSSKRSSGQIIDRGIYVILASVVLGILTEIAYAVRDVKNAQANVAAPNRTASSHFGARGTT